MRIDYLFGLEEQIDIIWEVGEIKSEYQRQNIPKKKNYYFRQIADKYGLAGRIEEQLKMRNQGSNKRELATKEDIARLFSVNRSTVIRYLKSKLCRKYVEYFEVLCRSQGGRRGGANGNKAANFRSHRNFQES